MISLSLRKFIIEVAGLEEHIDRYKDTQSLLEKYMNNGDPDATKLLSKASVNDIYHYRSNVVSLYGLFEQFIEDIIKEYIKQLCRIQPIYSNLNKNLKENYPDLSFSLYRKLEWPKFNYLRSSQVTEGLYNAINLDKSIILSEPFILNGGNYRYDEIKNALTRIGVTNLDNELRKYPPLNQDFVVKYNNPAWKTVSTEFLYFDLNDLVDRRNDIAHGANQMPSIKGVDLKNVTIDFVKKFAESLNSFLGDNLFDYLFQINSYYHPLNVFQHIVGGFELQSITIKTNQHVLCKKPAGIVPKYEMMVIQDIQMNGTNYTTLVVPSSPTQLGIKFDKTISSGCEFVFL